MHFEGLGTPERLHPMQAAFVKHDGYQCGYCTPGQICSAVAVLDEIARGVPSHVSADLSARPMLSLAELRERMSGNICRCGAYSNIMDAITEVAAAGPTKDVSGKGDRACGPSPTNAHARRPRQPRRRHAGPIPASSLGAPICSI
jgi:xanthine dehydrogenase iron-sulfur cluster and FAD-binding subunit A